MITLKDILIYYFAEILNMTSNRPLQLIKNKELFQTSQIDIM